MKIAVAAEGPQPEAEVSQRGGRAPYYLIFEDGQLSETVKNPFAAGSGGAGFSVAYMMAEKEVGLVLAGRLGGNMVEALESKGIGYHEVEDGSAAQAVAAAQD